MKALICSGCATRKNHFEGEEELRRKHTKKRFGVKIPKTNANRIKKTLDEEDIQIEDGCQGSDLEIIEYPDMVSNLSNIREKNLNDFTRTISPLSKIIKKVVVNSQIRKCEQFEQLNLTLEDEDDEESEVIINNNEEYTIQSNNILTFNSNSNSNSNHNNNNTNTNTNHNNSNNYNYNNINTTTELCKEIPSSSNRKKIYQRKLILSNSSSKNIANEDNDNSKYSNNNSKNDISISLFSNTSANNNKHSSNDNKLYSQLKGKSSSKDNHKEEKGKEKKRKITHNTNLEAHQVNDLELIENYQKLKQYEQLQQLKELEKMKELIVLSNKFNEMNNINSIQSMFPIQQIPQMPSQMSQMPIGIPYQQTIMTGSTIPTSPNNNPIQTTNGYSQPNISLIDSHTNHSNSNNDSNYINNNAIAVEPQSCTYCEEIYQYTIMNNLPLKKIKCLYCNIVMNPKTLEFYLVKYKKDLELKYKNNISPSKDKINEEDDNEEEEENEDEIDEEEEEEEEERKRIKREQERERERKKNRIKAKEEEELMRSSKPSKQTKNKIMPKPPIRNNRKKEERQNSEPLYTNNNTKRKPTNITSSTQVETKSDIEKEEQLINNNQGNNISLAEAFKSKRAKILTSIEKRSSSVKESSASTQKASIEPIESRIIRERRNQKQNKNESHTSSIVQEIKTSQSLNLSQTSRSKVDPSPDLMNRLIKGEKAKMSNKEMKELNHRLYNKLVDVRSKKEDTSKRDELARLFIVKKNYTNVSHYSYINNCNRHSKTKLLNRLTIKRLNNHL